MIQPYFQDHALTIYHGHALEVLKTLPDGSVNCCVTSPPYWGLRDYGIPGQIGLEKTPEEYVSKMVEIFREVRRVLFEDGTLWLNLGDCYATGAGSYRNPGSDVEVIKHGGIQAFTRDYARQQPNRMPIEGLKPKDMVGIPWRIAFALQADGWWLRRDIIWHKPNPMPESVKDRPTTAHEYIFLMSRAEQYYYNHDEAKEPARIRSDRRPFGKRDSGEHGQSERIYTPPSWNGSRFDDGKNAIVHPNVGKNRKPKGWDIEKGAHGSFHKNGRRKQDEAPKESRSAASSKMGREPGWRKNQPDVCFRNLRSVWTVPSQPYCGAHFATFPPDLVIPCILAGSPRGGTILDPFAGTGTTGMVAERFERKAVLIDLNDKYLKLMKQRNNQRSLFFNTVKSGAARTESS